MSALAWCGRQVSFAWGARCTYADSSPRVPPPPKAGGSATAISDAKAAATDGGSAFAQSAAEAFATDGGVALATSAAEAYAKGAHSSATALAQVSWSLSCLNTLHCRSYTVAWSSNLTLHAGKLHLHAPPSPLLQSTAVAVKAGLAVADALAHAFAADGGFATAYAQVRVRQSAGSLCVAAALCSAGAHCGSGACNFSNTAAHKRPSPQPPPPLSLFCEQALAAAFGEEPFKPYLPAFCTAIAEAATSAEAKGHGFATAAADAFALCS